MAINASLIMKVEDSFTIRGVGTVLSGANSRLDALDDAEIELLIGESIYVEQSNGSKRKLHVESVEVSISLLGKKNVNIALGENVTPDVVQAGSLITTGE